MAVFSLLFKVPPKNRSPTRNLDATEEKSLGTLIHHIGGQDRDEDAGGQGENVPTVVADVQILAENDSEALRTAKEE